MSTTPEFTIHYPEYEECTSFFGDIGEKIDVHEAIKYFCALKRDADWIKYFGNALSDLRDELDKLSRYIEETRIGQGRLYADCFYKEYQYILFALMDDFNEEDMDIQKPCFVYYISNFEKDMIKIGISNDPVGRAKAMQTSSGQDLEILNTIKFDCRRDALDAEKFLHSEFSYCRKKPTKVAKSSEWFDAKIENILLYRYDTKEKVQYYMKQDRCHQDYNNRKIEQIFKKEETA